MNGDGPGSRAVCAVYDGSCPFCRGAAAVGRRVTPRGSVRWIPSQDADALRAAGLDVGGRPASLLVWDGAGGPLTESRAVRAVAARIPYAGGALAWLLARAEPAADRLYRVVARNRHRVPGPPRRRPRG